MIKNKFILIILLILMFSLKGIALDSSYKNSLEEINIKKGAGGNYLINLLFDNTYTEPLSIQKKTSNSYSIILPETQISADNVKIIYKDGKDKIKLDVKEYPYLDQTIDNGYVKVTATTLGKVSLKVASDVKLLPKKNKINAKNIEIIKKEKTPIQSTAQMPVDTTKTEIPPLTIDTTEISNGSNEIGEKIPNIKNNLSPDYLGILMKISLALFILLITLRQLYKAFKNKKKAVQPKPDYRKKIDGTWEEPENTRNTPTQKITPQPNKQKSQFEAEVERLSQRESTQQAIYQETLTEDNYQEIEDEPFIYDQTVTEDEYEDEDFDYDFDYEDEGEIEEIAETSGPKLISTAPIDKNKGFYLVDYDGQTALIGYIKDEIFVINKFDKIYNPNLQTRLNERKKNKSIYLVRIDHYKALIEVSEKAMNVLIEF